jgi:AraC-like DNA-binding protein
VRTVIDDCQHIAGRAADRDPALLLTDLCATLRTVPEVGTAIDVAVARDVLGRTLSHIIRAARLEHEAEIAAALIRVVEAPATGPWRVALATLLYICGAVLDARMRRAGPPFDNENRYVRATLTFIDTDYRRSTCGLSGAAALVRLTPSHLSRILTRCTGEGFVAHLRRRRVVEAERLLLSGMLSIKEVATAVGYETSRQLERDVKRVCRVTPTSLRNRRAIVAANPHR